MSYRHSRVREITSRYDKNKLSIAVVASHSALDVLDGARDEGFYTIAICQRGREKTYTKHFANLINESIILDKFAQITEPEIIDLLLSRNAIIVPNRSFAVYVGYENIEERLPIPIFGNRWLLRYEERTGDKNYYRLLDEAKIRRPRTFSSPEEIDRPVIVKLPHAVKRVERGFFIAIDRDDFRRKANKMIDAGVIKSEDLQRATIEELVLGVDFNVNFFNSVAFKRLELISIDRRLQTDLAGFTRLTADVQLELLRYYGVEMIEIGHVPVTIRESVIERLFDYAERFVEACSRVEPPGIIGPFTLQLMVTKDLDIIVFDVATRIGGGTNAYMGIGSQYSKLYFGEPLSLGKRIALEIKECVRSGCLEDLVT